MNAPIQALYTPGQNLYAVILTPLSTNVWNQTAQNWEVYDSGHWVDYAVPLTEYTGSGIYRADYPFTPEASHSGLTTEAIFVRAGATPTLGDSPATNLQQSQGVNIGALGNLWLNAQKIAAAIGTQQLGTIVGTPSSGKVLPTDLTNPAGDAYAGRVVIMTTGDLAQQAARITAYSNSTFELTTLGFPGGGIPADGDAFIII